MKRPARPWPARLLPTRGSTGLSLRLARRLALQAGGRSVMVALLIAIPIIGLSAIDTVEASHAATPAEHLKLELGQTQARLRMVSAPTDKLRQNPLDETNWTTGTEGDGFPTEGTSADVVAPETVLPPGTPLLSLRYVGVVARTASGLGSLTAYEGDAYDPAFSGKFDLVDGRRPTKASEIMVTPAALTRLGVAIGDRVTVESPEKGQFTVVGTLTSSDYRPTEQVLFGTAGAFDGISASAQPADTDYYLPSTAVPWPMVQELNGHGAVVLSRAVVLGPPVVQADGPAPYDSGSSGSLTTVVFVALLGAFGMFEVCLLAGAAFAVGARQRQRSFAVLASVGADRGLLFRVLSIEGGLLGLVGGLVGTALGLVAAHFAMPIISGGRVAQFPGFHPDWPVLGVIVVGAMVSGWAAAALPARTASRVDVVAALRGARRPPRTSIRKPVIGIFVASLGSVVALAGGLVVIGSTRVQSGENTTFTLGIVLLVAGPVIMQIGVILILPLVLTWVMRLLSHLGAGARLGSRDASRNPSRTVPAVAAIMSTVFVAAFAMCMLSGGQVKNVKTYSWTAPLHQADVSLYVYDEKAGHQVIAPSQGIAEILDRDLDGQPARVLQSTPSYGGLGDSVATYTVPHIPASFAGNAVGPNGGTDPIAVGSVDDLALVVGQPVSARSRATLAAGGIVSLYPGYVTGGTVTLDTVPASKPDAVETPNPVSSTKVAASVQAPDHPGGVVLFMTAATADRLHIEHAPSHVVKQLDAAPPSEQTDRVVGDLQVLDTSFGISVETGPIAYAATWSWLLLGATTLIALVSSTIALALARADGRRDEQVLEAIGASPRVQRSFGFWQGVILAGLGGVIGVALGLVPAFALGLPQPGTPDGFLPFVPPPVQLLLTAFAMPLVIAVGAWATARRRRARWSVRAPLG